MTGTAKDGDEVAGKGIAGKRPGRCPTDGAGSERQGFDGAHAETHSEKAVILPFPGSLPAMRGGGQAPLWPVLRRPRLLITAARHGQQGYRRGRDLRRLMRSDSLPAPGRALAWLIGCEAEMDQARRAGLPEWDLQAHLLALIALLHEMQLARAADGRPGLLPGSRAGLVVRHPNPGRPPLPGSG